MILIAIVTACYLLVAFIKTTAVRSELLPIISGCVGAALTLLVALLLPSELPTTTTGSSIVCGLFLGLAATGGDQVYKQTVKYLWQKFVGTKTDDTDDDEA